MISLLDNCRIYSGHMDAPDFHLVRGDVRDAVLVKRVVEDADAVFHEAALVRSRALRHDIGL